MCKIVGPCLCHACQLITYNISQVSAFPQSRISPLQAVFLPSIPSNREEEDVDPCQLGSPGLETWCCNLRVCGIPKRRYCINLTVALQTGADAGSPPQFVREVRQPLNTAMDFDAVVCGGTLGIFLARALQVQGFRYDVPLTARELTVVSTITTALLTSCYCFPRPMCHQSCVCLL